jgi:hypothetical protein
MYLQAGKKKFKFNEIILSPVLKFRVNFSLLAIPKNACQA